LPAARSIDGAVPDDKVLSHECGYEVNVTDEAELVEEVDRVSTERSVRRPRAPKGGSS
jgi:hypothetical protein